MNEILVRNLAARDGLAHANLGAYGVWLFGSSANPNLDIWIWHPQFGIWQQITNSELNHEILRILITLQITKQ